MENGLNFEDRFARIDIQPGDQRPRNKPPTVARLPNLSTSKRAEARSISRSVSHNNLQTPLFISKTPSRLPNQTPRSILGSKKVARRQLSNESKSVGGTPFRGELSYMRDTTSSSMRKISNPFNNISPSSNRSKDSKTAITKLKPSDITNLTYERFAQPKRQVVSQPTPHHASAAPLKSNGDVYTRLYNDAKPRNSMNLVNNATTRRQPGLFGEKEIPKIQDLGQLYSIIYDEDPRLFEDTEPADFTCNNPKSIDEITNTNNDTDTSLEIYERGELLRRKDIYFIARNNDQNQRIININNYTNNYGFDDSSGNYVVILNDHIKYRYEIVSVLGKGSFGNVVKCLDKKYTNGAKNKVVAIKIIKSDLNWSLQAVYETKMLKHLNATNRTSVQSPYLEEYGNTNCPVLTYYDHFHFRGHMCIVTELLSINLFTMLEIVKFQGLSLKLLKTFCRKILQGLAYIHSMNVLHCDIKPENIMIKLPSSAFLDDNLDEDSIIIKIVDFGTSCFTNEISYSYIQSRFYRAPEVIIGAKYDNKIDIWSFGCIVTELLTGDPLLPGRFELEQIGLILELFGAPSSNLILQQRNTLLRSIREQKAVSKINDLALSNPNFIATGGADEKSIKRTLLYTLFDMEGKVNMQFLNMRIQAAHNPSKMGIQSRKTYKLSSRNLEIRLKLRQCREDPKDSNLFLKFLENIFRWDPSERLSATQLLEDQFLAE